jgi:choline dehydrogenase
MKENSVRAQHDTPSNTPRPVSKTGRRDFLAKLVALGASAAGIDMFADYALAVESSQSAPLRDSYDYIIIGAGSAGCLLANRLSATGASVLLIEAGSSSINVPKIARVAFWQENLSSDTEWGRVSVPQAGLDNRKQAALAGKVWGGSGSINAMIWLRGDPRDLQQWNRLVGPEWSPEALNRAYLKLTQPATSVCRTVSGGTGRITVGRYADKHPLTAAYLAAGANTGLKTIELNAGLPLNGVGVTEVNATEDGRRAGPAQSLLVPALVRPNLKVLSDTLITKLVLQGTTCRGVEAVVNQTTISINATRETLVCAGACESPRILMLSGLGPSDQLAPLNIQVRQDMAFVGKNLQDHLLLSVLFKSKATLPPQVSNGVSTMAYYSNSSPLTAPDIQVAGMQYPFLTPDLPATGGYTVIPFLAKPRSRGRVQLVSADPRQALNIDPHYLEESVDRDNMVFGLDRALETGTNRALRGFYDSLHVAAPLKTRNDKLAFIAANGAPGLHLVGTCSAGRDPASSVVDAHFRVWGIDKLRVVDASVIPEVPAVNIHASVLAIAQLAADQLIGEA